MSSLFGPENREGKSHFSRGGVFRLRKLRLGFTERTEETELGRTLPVKWSREGNAECPVNMGKEGDRAAVGEGGRTRGRPPVKMYLAP